MSADLIGTLVEKRQRNGKAEPAPVPAPAPGPEHPEVMNIRQACAFLGISAATLHRAMRRGEIPFRKLGSRTLFSRAVLLAWLAGPDATT